jgi:hypothetical protein
VAFARIAKVVVLDRREPRLQPNQPFGQGIHRRYRRARGPWLAGAGAFTVKSM